MCSRAISFSMTEFVPSQSYKSYIFGVGFKVTSEFNNYKIISDKFNPTRHFFQL